jgi:hypothetical protein
MSDDRGVFGLYSDGPIGMDDPRFMVRTEARRVASWAADEGLDLHAALQRARDHVITLFGQAPQPLVDASATAAWLESATGRRQP